MRKVRVLSVLLLLCLFCSLASCGGERYDALVVIDDAEGLTFSVRGSGNRAKQVTVKRGEELLFAQKVKVDRKVGSLGGTYGFQVLDLNFDGHSDMMLVDKVAGEEKRYVCWIADGQGGYHKSLELSGLCNIQADEKLEMLMSYSHSFYRDREYSDVPSATVTTDTVTRYIWVDGVATPFRRVSLTAYSETHRYCYSVSDYNTEEGAFSEPDDVWLSEEEYKQADFSFIFYFR